MEHNGRELGLELIAAFNSLEKVTSFDENRPIAAINNYSFRIEHLDQTGIITAALAIKYAHLSNFRDSHRYSGTVCSIFLDELNNEFITLSTEVSQYHHLKSSLANFHLHGSGKHTEPN